MFFSPTIYVVAVSFFSTCDVYSPYFRGVWADGLRHYCCFCRSLQLFPTHQVTWALNKGRRVQSPSALPDPVTWWATLSSATVSATMPPTKKRRGALKKCLVRPNHTLSRNTLFILPVPNVVLSRGHFARFMIFWLLLIHPLFAAGGV